MPGVFSLGFFCYRGHRSFPRGKKATPAAFCGSYLKRFRRMTKIRSPKRYLIPSVIRCKYLPQGSALYLQRITDITAPNFTYRTRIRQGTHDMT